MPNCSPLFVLVNMLMLPAFLIHAFDRWLHLLMWYELRFPCAIEAGERLMHCAIPPAVADARGVRWRPIHMPLLPGSSGTVNEGQPESRLDATTSHCGARV